MVLSLVGSIKGGEISSAGLRIVILQISEVECSNIVVKSGLRSLTRTPINSISSKTSSSSMIIDCFLKSCHLCKKPLCLDKDVYMYRGDQGFCSIECRNRQIMVDEMKEMEVKTKKRLATSTTSIDCAGCETCKLLEDLRRRRHHRNNKFKSLVPPTKQQQPLLSFS